MNGFVVFARKEVQEIFNTWRIWVLPCILLFFAMAGPLLAKFTPEIVKAVAGNQLKGIEILTPTYLDAYSQWIKNLSQIVLIALIIIYGGIISSESKGGTAILVLTKPISRTNFVTAKVLVHSVFVSFMVIVGTCITWGLTAILFGTAPESALWSSVLEWLVLGILFVALMTLLSVLIHSSAGAAGAGLGVYALLSIAAIWKPLSIYSPAAIGGQTTSLAAGKIVAWQWPVLTSLLLATAIVAVAVATFRRKEL